MRSNVYYVSINVVVPVFRWLVSKVNFNETKDQIEQFELNTRRMNIAPIIIQFNKLLFFIVQHTWKPEWYQLPFHYEFFLNSWCGRMWKSVWPHSTLHYSDAWNAAHSILSRSLNKYHGQFAHHSSTNEQFQFRLFDVICIGENTRVAKNSEYLLKIIGITPFRWCVFCK